jgi:hypothetical protein
MAKELRSIATWLGLAALILSALALYVFIDHKASRMGQTVSPPATSSAMVVAGTCSRDEEGKMKYVQQNGGYTVICQDGLVVPLVTAGSMSSVRADNAPFCSCTYGEFDLVCSNVMLGDRCSCRDNGARMKLDDSIGRCFDGRVVSESVYKKYSADPKFEYTQCPDPRNKDK